MNEVDQAASDAIHRRIVDGPLAILLRRHEGLRTPVERGREGLLGVADAEAERRDAGPMLGGEPVSEGGRVGGQQKSDLVLHEEGGLHRAMGRDGREAEVAEELPQAGGGMRCKLHKGDAADAAGVGRDDEVHGALRSVEGRFQEAQ